MAQNWIRYGVGLDMSSADFMATFVGQNEAEQIKIIAKRKFPNTHGGFEQLHQWVEKKAKKPDLPLRMVMEVTGVYHENLLYQLDQWGYYVSLELGKRTKRYAQSLGIDTKTDPTDAYVLAHMAVSRKLKRWKPITKEAYQVRQILRLREETMESRVAFQNRLHSAQRAHYPDPGVIRSLRRTIKHLIAEEKRLEQQATEMIKKDPEVWKKITRIVKSLPGVGLLSMLKVVVETNGFEAFRSAKQLTRYAGYDIVEKQSGSYKGKTKISKQGNARLRKTLYMPALAHTRCTEGPIKQLYLRVIQRTGLTKKAQTAAQRKLLCLIFALWKSDQTYDPNYQNIPRTLKEGSSDRRPELHEIAPA